MLKKGDIVIICLVLSAAVLSLGAALVLSRPASRVTVKENNELIFEGSLNEDKTIELGKNTVVIKNGRVRVSDADCKNQICVNQGEISKSGESIICLPNRVIIEIE